MVEFVFILKKLSSSSIKVFKKLMFKPFVILSFALITMASCNEEIPDEIIPYAYVNLELNLNLVQHQKLRNLGGYLYIDPIENAGYKGIIVYHEGNDIYKVFERACSFDPRVDCTPVVVDESGLFMLHKCCNSSFNFNGNPTGGPASLDLVQYRTFVDGIYLKITN